MLILTLAYVEDSKMTNKPKKRVPIIKTLKEAAKESRKKYLKRDKNDKRTS